MEVCGVEDVQRWCKGAGQGVIVQVQRTRGVKGAEVVRGAEVHV